MQITWGRAARALFVAVFLSLGILNTGQASAAEPGPYQVESRMWPGYCLDTDGYHVVLEPCDDRQQSQKWIIWNGGFTKNYGFGGMCLYGQPHFVNQDYELFLQSCNVNRQELYWRNWSPEWFKNLRSNACLKTASVVRVVTSRCVEERQQFWNVNFLG